MTAHQNGPTQSVEWSGPYHIFEGDSNPQISESRVLLFGVLLFGVLLFDVMHRHAIGRCIFGLPSVVTVTRVTVTCRSGLFR